MTRRRIAVVGSGVAGLTAAHVLGRHHQVSLYEREPRFGGHSNTVAVPGADGEVGVDTGFIVHNRLTYPHLIRLFDELGVETQPSDMSFGVRCDGCGLEYAGARGTRGVFARRSSATRPAYLRMLAEVRRFHREARRLLADPAGDRLTMGEFLDRGRYSHYCREHFVLPLSGAIWSCSRGQMLSYPARYLVRFFANHGMLTVRHSPNWRTVTGGSSRYVERIVARLGDDVHLASPVRSIARRGDGVVVADESHGEQLFDAVVIATHPDQALAVLDDPSERERAVLSRFRYEANETVLHTDSTLLPVSAGARASWNSLLEGCDATESQVHVTYHMNRLQALREPVDYCVTLNGNGRISAASEISRMVYDHPVYTLDTIEAQRGLPMLSHGRTAFCGAYHGWGFHEDGCVSGIRAALALGCPL